MRLELIKVERGQMGQETDMVKSEAMRQLVKGMARTVVEAIKSKPLVVQVPLDPDFRALKVRLPEHSHGRLSPTQIDMYLRCAQQFCFRYELGLRYPPGVSLVEGTSHHEALNMNNKAKAKTGKDLPVNRVAERFADEFTGRKKEIAEWEGEKPDTVIKRGVFLLREYMGKFAPRLLPSLVEQELLLNLGPVEIVGYLDVAGVVRSVLPGPKNAKPRKTVIDYKTAGRIKSEAELAGSIQLSMYGWAGGKLLDESRPEVGYCVLLKTKEPRIVHQTTTLTGARLQWFRRVSLSVADAITRGAYPVCDPTAWCCCERFCGYFHLCRGKTAGRRKAR